ncbi:MAG: hypothetical protein ABT01_03470 [Clostridium sp. SCN 57-10]|nr:MAG: hypothetical protein ABT01_03470 [Clostridium sp. SCN 57-10]
MILKGECAVQKHVVVARFDAQTDQIFTRWRRALGASQSAHADDSAAWPPHLTIAAYEGVDIGALCAWTREYTASRTRVDLCFGSLGVFAHGPAGDTDVIFAHPNESAALTALHTGFHQKLDEFCGDYGRHCTPESPSLVLHATIAICRKDEFSAMFDVLRAQFSAIRAIITALEVYENPCRLIERCELQSK